MEFLFSEYRLDWFGAGPSSPNKTGALLAIVFVAAWWPAFRFRWGFWLSLPVTFVVAGLLLQTESRGALVGLGVGMFTLLGFWLLRVRSTTTPTGQTGHPSLKRRGALLWRVLAGLGFAGVLLVYSNQLGVNSRMSEMTSGGDESANVRVRLYTAGFQMIAAAPQGWGAGEAGDVYAQWYQTVGDSRSYLSLVNSHLTWMSDYGLLFQFGYIAVWCAVLLMLWPVPWAPLRGVSFAVWGVLGICGFFSSVLTLLWLWVIPGVLLMLCLIQRFKLRVWPTRRHCIFASLCLLCGVVGLRVVSASLAGDISVAATPEQVKIGANPEAVLIVAPNRQILGDKYGHTIRESMDILSGATVLRYMDDISGLDISQYDALLFSGAIPAVALDGYTGRVVLLNPVKDIDDRAIASLADHALTIVVGSLGDWRRGRVWSALVDGHPNWNLIELRGVADFIPNWPQYLKPSMEMNERE